MKSWKENKENSLFLNTYHGSDCHQSRVVLECGKHKTSGLELRVKKKLSPLANWLLTRVPSPFNTERIVFSTDNAKE